MSPPQVANNIALVVLGFFLSAHIYSVCACLRRSGWRESAEARHAVGISWEGRLRSNGHQSGEYSRAQRMPTTDFTDVGLVCAYRLNVHLKLRRYHLPTTDQLCPSLPCSRRQQGQHRFDSRACSPRRCHSLAQLPIRPFIGVHDAMRAQN